MRSGAMAAAPWLLRSRRQIGSLACMSTRNRIALLLAIVSLALLWPGLVQPVLTIRATMEMFGVERELSNETRSVVGAIESLHQTGNDFVAGLILLFSVLIPLIKAALLAPMLLLRESA